MNGLGAFLVDASPGMMVLLKLTGLLGVGLVLNLMLLRMNPRWRVLMWRGVLVGTVVLCVGEVPAPKFLIAFEAVVEAPVAPDVEMSVVVDAFPAGPPEMFREQPDGLLESPGLGVDYGAEMSGDPMVERGDEALDSGTVYRIANPVWGLMAEHTWEVLYLGWLVVTSILLIRILIVAGRIRGIVHTARSAPREVLEAAESVSSELGCDVGFDVRVMRDLGSPFLVGIRRPIVVLPERMVEDDAGRDLSGVLAHELTHVRSNDVFWLLCNRIAASVLWFHPLVWIGLRSHGAACEDVCDAVAADYVGDREAYTGSLARTALLVAEGSVASGGLMVRGSKITGRIR